MIRLWLCRHGNTFEAHEASRWIGARENLPLTQKGKDQALKLKTYFQNQAINWDAAWCAPLLRTTTTCDILLQGQKVQPNLCDELSELDYGRWAGKTDLEIRETFGDFDFFSWKNHGIYPKSANFSPSPEVIEEYNQAILHQLFQHYTQLGSKSDCNFLMISSQGRLKQWVTYLTKGHTPAPINTGNFGMGEIHFLKDNSLVQAPFQWHFDLKLWNQKTS